MKCRPFHHQRPLVAVAAAYGAGIWAGVRFSYAPLLYLLGLALSIVLGLVLFRTGKRCVTAIMAAFLFVGMLLSGYISHPALPPKGSYLVEGIVAEDVELREDGTVAGYLADVTLTSDGGSYRLSRVYWTYTADEEAPFLPLDGERVRFSASLYHPSGQTNPYGFDFRLFLLQKGVTAGVSGARDAAVLDRPGRGISSFFYQLRNDLSGRAEAIFGEGSALAQTLLLGVKENLPDQVQESFSAAGIAHVLAISGLHVGLMAGVLQMLMKRWLSPGKRLGVMVVFLGSYCCLLGFSAPVVRASILIVIAGLQKRVRRASDPLTALAFAFLLLLLFRPLDLFSVSFQLSFGAVLGIVMLRPGLERMLAPIPAALRSGVVITLAATAGAVLPTIQVFHRFSIIGLLINPLVCAFFGVLLPVYGAVLLVGCISLPVGAFLAQPVNWAVGWLIEGITWLGDLPFASLRMPALPWYLIAALIFAVLACTRYLTLSKGLRGVLAVTGLIISVGVWRLGVCTDVQYLQFEMGQADAALILDGHETILIDAGEYGGDLSDYLLATGRQADHVIITHLHADHCLGLREIMEDEIPIGQVTLPVGAREQQISQDCLDVIAALEEMGVPIIEWAAGDELCTERVRIQATWPIDGTVHPMQDANRYPLALLCDLDGVRLFAASDLLGEFEHYAARDADILKVAHHGSKGSTWETFLSLVTPQMALITGSPGSKTLPHADTLNRLAQSGVSVYNTGDWGALHIRIWDGQAILTPYLAERDEP